MKRLILFTVCWLLLTTLYAQKDKAYDRISSIKKQLSEGTDFCTLAKKYSQDYSSARYCGQIGLHEKGELVRNYSEAMIALKPGEISNIIETEFGYHIIQLLSIQGNKYETRHILIKR